MTASLRIRRSSPRACRRSINADHAARRADCAGKHPDAARLSAQLSARSRAGNKKGQRLSRDALRAQLDGAGYRHVDQVMEHGNTRPAARCLTFTRWAATSRIVWISLMMKSTACASSTPTRSARWRKWSRSIYCPRMSSRRTKPLSNCSAASGAISSR